MHMIPLVLGLLLCPQKGPGDALKKAIEATEASKSYTYKFDMKTEIANGDPIEAAGRGVMVSSNKTLFLEIKGTGGMDKKLIVKPEGTLIWRDYFLEGDWFRAEEFADPQAGRGVENPQVVMDAIKGHLAAATRTKKGDILIRLEGKEAVGLIKQFRMNAAAVQEDGTWIEITSNLKEGKISTVECKARARLAEGSILGSHAKTTVRVTVEAYDRDKKLDWPNVKDPK